MFGNLINMHDVSDSRYIWATSQLSDMPSERQCVILGSYRMSCESNGSLRVYTLMAYNSTTVPSRAKVIIEH